MIIIAVDAVPAAKRHPGPRTPEYLFHAVSSTGGPASARHATSLRSA